MSGIVRLFVTLSLFFAFTSETHADDPPKRELTGKAATIKVPAFKGVTKAVVNPPAYFFISKDQRGTSFDLKGGTLNFVASNLVQVYPLVYQGKVGDNIYVYWESSPYGWVWYFEDKGGFNGAVYYQETADKPVIEFDLKAAKNERKP